MSTNYFSVLSCRRRASPELSRQLGGKDAPAFQPGTPGRWIRRILMGLIAALSLWPCHAADLFRDDFSKFPPGWLSSPVGLLNAAIQEYHYLPHRGVPL